MKTTPDQWVTSAVNRYLMPFCVAVDPTYQISWHHEAIALTLEKALEDLMERNISTNIILTVPPRHGKSDLTSQKFPAWALGKYPDIPIILASYAAEIAESFGQKTRDIMEREEFQAHFNTRLRPDSKAKARWQTIKPGEADSEGEAEMVNTKNGGYTAAGVGGPITGRGFKIGIIDDPIKNRQDADSEVMRDTVWDWYKSTFRTRQEGAAIKIVIVTRWHQDDIVGRLLAQQEADKDAGEVDYDKWKVINFPAIAENKEDHRNPGDPLWPEKFTLSQLTATKNALGPYDWEALYQQNPIPSEKQEFKKEWFTYYTPKDLKGKELEYMTTVDLAIGESNKDDETVITTVGKEKTKPDWYIVRSDAGHFTPGETIDHIFRHAKDFKSTVGLEVVQYQKALKYFIVEEQRKREMYFHIYELKRNQGTAKEIRIRGLIPLYVAGVIHHVKGVHQKLENQLLSFPQGRHDDHPDALASQLEMWSGTLYDGKNPLPRKSPPISDMQGTIEPTVNGIPEDDGVFGDIDIAKL